MRLYGPGKTGWALLAATVPSGTDLFIPETMVGIGSDRPESGCGVFSRGRFDHPLRLVGGRPCLRARSPSPV
jgi:hypothetical protein